MSYLLPLLPPGDGGQEDEEGEAGGDGDEPFEGGENKALGFRFGRCYISCSAHFQTHTALISHKSLNYTSGLRVTS